MITRRLRIQESLVTVTAASDRLIEVAAAAIAGTRREIERYIRSRRTFLTSLEPLRCGPDAPPVVRRMAAAAERAGVGPMAAVAGAVAEAALAAMIEAGARHAIVENGGDIAMLLDQPVTAAVFAGRRSRPRAAGEPRMDAAAPDLGLRFEPRSGPFGVCTSSGTVGHSLSFGVADAATVIAADVCLADAAATALGNKVTAADPGVISAALENGCVQGIDGALVVCGGYIGTIGELPEIVAVTPEAVAAALDPAAHPAEADRIAGGRP